MPETEPGTFRLQDEHSIIEPDPYRTSGVCTPLVNLTRTVNGATFIEVSLNISRPLYYIDFRPLVANIIDRHYLQRTGIQQYTCTLKFPNTRVLQTETISGLSTSYLD